MPSQYMAQQNEIHYEGEKVITCHDFRCISAEEQADLVAFMLNEVEYTGNLDEPMDVSKLRFKTETKVSRRAPDLEPVESFLLKIDSPPPPLDDRLSKEELARTPLDGLEGVDIFPAPDGNFIVHVKKKLDWEDRKYGPGVYMLKEFDPNEDTGADPFNSPMGF